MTAPSGIAWASVRDRTSPVITAGAIPWPRAVELLTTHTVGDKDGPGFLPAAIGPGPRKGERVERVDLLVLDVEAAAETVKTDDGREGRRVIGQRPPTLDAMAAELELWGLAGVLSTSYSHEAPAIDGGTLGPRYRLALPLSRPIKPAEVRPLAEATAAMLGIGQCVDRGCFEPARLFYLPRCPAERRHLAQAREVQGRPLDVDALLKAAAAPKAAPKRATGARSASVIQAFNDAHDVGAILKRYGYEPAGAWRYRWPGSTTGVAGVVVFPDSGRCYSHHAADPLHCEHGRDAFDAWCVLEHGGDTTAAVREAARILGMGGAGAGFAADSQKFAGLSQGANRPESKHSCGFSQNSQDSQRSPRDDDSQGFDRAAAIKRARVLLAPSIKSKAAPYPIDALGPLADACKAIAEGGQVEAAVAGQCLLGAAALLTQGLRNVETLAGPRPLSVYALTLGYSGDGKSIAQGVALAPVHEWQREQGKAYAEAQRDYENARAKRKKGDDVPEPPRSPYRLVGDATVEGLRRDLESGPCSQGVFTDEAATILGGYGMSAEQRGKTAAVFSKLWDAGHLSVSRVAGGRVERYGCRVALHWLIQPMAAAEAVADPLLAALGFWPRFLAAWPPELEPRKALTFEPSKSAPIGHYWRRCADLLEQPLPDDAGRALLLPLADDARALMGKAFERFEVEGRKGSLRSVKPFALRATEQACRIAGVLAAFGGRASIDGETARSALALAAYSLDTWRALIDDGAADPGTAHALRLYEWLTERPGWHARMAAIVKDGPACVRSKDKRDAAIDLLCAVGLAEARAGEAYALLPPAEDA